MHLQEKKKNVQSSFPACNQQISWLTPGPRANSQNSLSGREEGWQVDAGTDWVLDLGSTLCLSGFEELKTEVPLAKIFHIVLEFSKCLRATKALNSAGNEHISK